MLYLSSIPLQHNCWGVRAEEGVTYGVPGFAQYLGGRGRSGSMGEPVGPPVTLYRRRVSLYSAPIIIRPR